MKEWGTDLIADPSFFHTMALVRLPDDLIGPGGPEVLEKGIDGQPHYDCTHAAYLGNKLHCDYKIEVQYTICEIWDHLKIASHCIETHRS